MRYVNYIVKVEFLLLKVNLILMFYFLKCTIKMVLALSKYPEKSWNFFYNAQYVRTTVLILTVHCGSLIA